MVWAAGAIGGILGGLPVDDRRAQPGARGAVDAGSSAPACLAIALTPEPVALRVMPALFEVTSLV